VQVLETISPDLAYELGYLFIDSRGWNLRDDLAHGILPPDTDSRFSLLCVIVLLTLSTLIRRNQPE
jgi:hypothetical protein